MKWRLTPLMKTMLGFSWFFYFCHFVFRCSFEESSGHNEIWQWEERTHSLRPHTGGHDQVSLSSQRSTCFSQISSIHLEPSQFFVWTQTVLFLSQECQSLRNLFVRRAATAWQTAALCLDSTVKWWMLLFSLEQSHFQRRVMYSVVVLCVPVCDDKGKRADSCFCGGRWWNMCVGRTGETCEPHHQLLHQVELLVKWRWKNWSSLKVFKHGGRLMWSQILRHHGSDAATRHDDPAQRSAQTQGLVATWRRSSRALAELWPRGTEGEWRETPSSFFRWWVWHAVHFVCSSSTDTSSTPLCCTDGSLDRGLNLRSWPR